RWSEGDCRTGGRGSHFGNTRARFERRDVPSRPQQCPPYIPHPQYRTSPERAPGDLMRQLRQGAGTGGVDAYSDVSISKGRRTMYATRPAIPAVLETLEGRTLFAAAP